MMKKILIIFASLVVFMGGFVFDLMACPTGKVCPRGGVCVSTSECVNPNTVESLDLTRDQLGLTSNPGGPQGSKPSVTSHDSAQGDKVKPTDVVTKSVDANDANDKPLTPLTKNRISTIVPQTPGQYIQTMRSVMKIHEEMARDRQARETQAKLKNQWTQESGCDKAQDKLNKTYDKWKDVRDRHGEAKYEIDKIKTDLDKANKDLELVKKIYKDYPDDSMAKKVRTQDAMEKANTLHNKYYETKQNFNFDELESEKNEAFQELQDAQQEASAAELHYNQLEANYNDAQEASLPSR